MVLVVDNGTGDIISVPGVKMVRKSPSSTDQRLQTLRMESGEDSFIRRVCDSTEGLIGLAQVAAYHDGIYGGYIHVKIRSDFLSTLVMGGKTEGGEIR
jgi:hypothetical protein